MKTLALKTKELPSEQKLFVLQLHAEGTDINGIALKFKQSFKESLDIETIRDTCLTSGNQVYIERFRDKYLANVKSVPIANKRVRIDDFQKIRDKLFNMVEQLSTRGKENRSEIITIFRTIKEILSVTREEMEGKPGFLTQVNITDLSGYSDEELRKRKEILIAKELGTYVSRNIGIGEDSERGDTAETIESAQVPLATSNQL